MNATKTYDYKIQRPLLAADTKNPENLKKLRYPLMASYKLDGIRCLTLDHGFVVSRAFKPIPNDALRTALDYVPLYLDGELVTIDPQTGKAHDFNTIQGNVMSHEGEHKAIYYVFDSFENPDNEFFARLWHAQYDVSVYNKFRRPDMSKLEVMVLPHRHVENADEVLEFFTEATQLGYEGVMLRDPGGVYKSGRSTLKQQILLKYKGLENIDAEGTVIGFEELYHNGNEQTRDAFGLAVRSSHKENKIAAGKLGALILDTRWGELRVGTGFDMTLRELIWNKREWYLGKIVTFKYQESGMKDLPRFPVFKGFRDPKDM